MYNIKYKEVTINNMCDINKSTTQTQLIKNLDSSQTQQGGLRPNTAIAFPGQF